MPKHITNGQQDEDDGYLMCFVYDWKTKETQFVMWDAHTFQKDSVFEANTKSRVPHGFHTYFVTETEMNY